MTHEISNEDREHVARPLFDGIGAEAFGKVATWLRDVASEHALEYDGKVMPPSVSWLAEAVSYYDPNPPALSPEEK